MKIWIDADACPKAVKEVVFRASERRRIPVVMVANHTMRVPRSSLVTMQLVPKGFDVADERIVEQVASEDLVITSDIPLAAAIVEKGATGINPRGELYTEDNVRARLSMRDFMDELRGGGLLSGGPPPYSPSDKRSFANALDRILTKAQRK